MQPKTKITLLVSAAVLLLAAVLFFRFSPSATGLLWQASNGGTWLLPLLVVASLLDSINPCAFSILVLTIAFLFSLGRLKENVLRIGLTYILGIFVVYILIGLGILSALHIFNTPHFMARLGAVLLVALGLINLINHFFPAFPIKLRIPQAAHAKIADFMHRASIPAAFLLGALVGLCEFPCTGGPYLMVLGLLHDQTTYLSGFGYLLLYNLIFVLPLVVILFLTGNEMTLKKVDAWRKKESGRMHLWSGLLMVLLGLAIFAL